jgi:hypothetical protein
VSTRCADGDADAELRCALLDSQGQQAEDADAAKQQRDGGNPLTDLG